MTKISCALGLTQILDTDLKFLKRKVPHVGKEIIQEKKMIDQGEHLTVIELQFLLAETHIKAVSFLPPSQLARTSISPFSTKWQAKQVL